MNPAMATVPLLPLPSPPTSSPSNPNLNRPSSPRTKSRAPSFHPIKHRGGGQLPRHGAAPPETSADLAAYSALIKSCIRRRDLDRGKLLHRRLLDSGLRLDSVVSNSLIALYSKCGDWDTACSVFEQMGSSRNLVSWTTMVSAAAQSGMGSRSLSIFCEMLELGFRPNEFTFSSAIRACSSQELVPAGMAVFGLVVKSGLLGHGVSVGSALVDMFAKTRDLVSARKVFDRMTQRNLVVWTLMITRYSQHGFSEEAVDLFIEMCSSGFEPDKFAMSGAMSACSELGSFRLGQQLHSLAVRSRLASDVCVGGGLVDMYAKCADGGSMEIAKKVFDHMPEHNVMSWSSVIAGYAQGGQSYGAIEVFCEMMIEGITRPNHFTYSSLLKACSDVDDPGIGEQVCSLVVKSGLATTNIVGNSLVTMYSRSGRLEDASKAFDSILNKNIISYNAVIDGCIKNSRSEEAFEKLQEMEGADVGTNSFTFASLLSAAASIGTMNKGQQLHARLMKAGFFESDTCVGNALVSMYSLCGDIEDARRVFDEMGDWNAVSWTSMITALAKHGCAAEALASFSDMVSSGAEPNEVTYLSVLSACSHGGLAKEGWEHFHSMQRDHGIVPRMEHYSCMVDLLGRKGLLDEAAEFIRDMPCEADALVWRTLLGACRTHGDIELGELCAKRVAELDPCDSAARILLSNLHASVGNWTRVADIRRGIKERGLNKEAGSSWVEVENRVHRFHAGDTSHPRAAEIFAELGRLVAEIRKLGYVPDTSLVLHDVEGDDEMKEQVLLQHSEKIAVAYALIGSSAPKKPVRVFKNLRVCGDCHAAIKLVSVATGREIVLRDSNRFHRMEDGRCSCGEYW